MTTDLSHHRRFVLQRHEDESGVSGTGTVAWGIEFPDGVVALRWISAWPTSVVFHDRGMAAVRAVHGHGGKTEIVWLDAKEEGAKEVAREISTRRIHNGIVHEMADLGVGTMCGIDLPEPWTHTDDPVTCEECWVAEARPAEEEG